HRGYAIYPGHFTSHRRVVGHFVVFVKKLLQKLLTPIWERQAAYNAANTRVTTHLWEQAEALRQQQATALQVMQQTGTAQVEELEQRQAAVAAVGQRQAESLESLRTAVDAQVAGLQQRQAEALKILEAWRTAVDAQVAGLQQQTAVGQRQAEALETLRTD